LTSVEKELALYAAEHQLELTGETRGVNPVEQREEFVVRLDLAGVQGLAIAGEPCGRGRRGFSALILLQLLNEAMQTGSLLGTHVHELHAHATARPPVAYLAAGANFPAGNIED
jgi:hypothetical protein